MTTRSSVFIARNTERKPLRPQEAGQFEIEFSTEFDKPPLEAELSVAIAAIAKSAVNMIANMFIGSLPIQCSPSPAIQTKSRRPNQQDAAAKIMYLGKWFR